jgi:pyridine nucleotide-disulfide oxidoreductase
MNLAATDVAIIGSGPYGLALATHLRSRGIEHRIFGPPMQTWRSMSPGMYLKSLGFATNIYTPRRHFTLPEYCLARGLEEFEPIAIADFARYGMWVQQQLVPYAEEAKIRELGRLNGMFTLTLETGEHVRARRVVVAVGLSYYEHLPTVLSDLPRELASHTSEHGDFTPFAGSDVTVLGGGQSALQAAALLYENGAKVRMVVRQEVHWGGHMPRGQKRSLIERVRVPSSVLGHGRDNWVLQHVPMLMHYLPAERRLQFTHEHLGPGGAWWLRDRVEGKFPIQQRCEVTEATVKQGKIALRVQQQGLGESSIRTDHVIAGTGYKVDVDRLAFMNWELAREIRRIERAPRLSRHFESSVEGLYFVGPASAPSFGPLFRFVAGAAYTAPTVARHLAWRSGKMGSVLRRPAGIAAAIHTDHARPN